MWLFGRSTKKKSQTKKMPKKYTFSHVNDESPEEIAVKQLRSSVKDILKSHQDNDDYLRKWLKARNYDVMEAERMFRNSMAFRKKIGADTLLQKYTPPEVIQKYLTGGFCGFDKDGSPVRVELFGLLDIKGLMYSARKVDLEKTKMLQCEKTVRDWEIMSKKLGKKVGGLTVIFDMAGVTTKWLWKPGLDMYLHLVKVLEDNYPEMMKRLIVINAPSIFPILYKLARPLISDDMKKKIIVLGSNFTQVLLQYVDAEQLPVYLGGKLTDPDGNPRCTTMICQGGQVPESYFLKNHSLGENMTAATVSKKLELKFEVQKSGMILRWEFQTEGYDIGFGVGFLENDGSVKFVLPVERVNSHMVPEDGSINCTEQGTYVLVFDNSFSWARSKKVSYQVEVIEEDKNILEEVENIGYVTDKLEAAHI
ncbi:retinal-binding protein [Lingula anatina]|uniref:Retinal-binding protein n=2 Tax=Lingula anatina TaxID=7574 RepID=A0A1S3H1V7_LINAN|nr:retinal-binding protein [Lingula anatina]|eukprot:XP_013379466.1 retinal-binding protein [Lingula anatina]